MFLRCKKRRKDGIEHLCWNFVENRRISVGRVLQRQVLYLGELNGRQAAVWRKPVELFGEDSNEPSQVALFDENHLPSVVSQGEVPIVASRLLSMRLVRPRQWGAAGLGANCGGSLVRMRSGSINFPQDDRGHGGIKFCRFSPSTLDRTGKRVAFAPSLG
jgi:hypothetical protein